MPSLVVCNKNKFATVDIEEKHGILIIIVILFVPQNCHVLLEEKSQFKEMLIYYRKNLSERRIRKYEKDGWTLAT